MKILINVHPLNPVYIYKHSTGVSLYVDTIRYVMRRYLIWKRTEDVELLFNALQYEYVFLHWNLTSGKSEHLNAQFDFLLALIYRRR
jgi:hypothetical protein